MNRSIKFNDVRLQYIRMKKEIDRTLLEALGSGSYILGDRVRAFESAFADYCGTRHCVGVGSGTEALFLSLIALGIAPGDEVITVSNTAVATVVPIALLNAVPVFVDVEPGSFNIDVRSIREKITKKTRAIIPVHLYGNPLNMRAITAIAREHGLKVIEDACQAHGSSVSGKKVGSFGDVGCFSFYPTKNLGTYGDGGAIVTDSPAIYRKLKLLRFYGTEDGRKYKVVGFNSRLDEIHAAVLLAKLPRLEELNGQRRAIARIYSECIKAEDVVLPSVENSAVHNFHLYVIKTKKRDALRSYLMSKGVETLIHYPRLIHLQAAYKYLGYKKGDLPVSEKINKQILSLPMYPQLPEGDVRYVARQINRFFGGPA